MDRVQDEVRGGREVVEISLAWGSSVLSLTALGSKKEFVLGEGEPGGARPDLFLPEEVLGVPSHRLLSVDLLGVVRVHAAPSASGWVRLADGHQSELSSQSEFVLTRGGRAHLQFGDFVVTVRAVGRAQSVPRGFGASDFRTPLAYWASTAAVFAGLLGSFAFFVPPLGLTDESTIDKDRLVVLKQYMAASAQRELETPKPEPTNDESRAPGRPSGEAAAGAPGAAGKTEPTPNHGRFAVRQTQPDAEEVFLAKMRAREEAATFGMIGLLNPGPSGDLGPVSPFGRDVAQGLDALSADGAMWGDTLGDAVGSGGLSLSGVDEGGGKRGRWIGMNGINTIGPGSGGVGGWGNNPLGGNGGGHKTRTPKMTAPPATVSGHLPAEVIQRTVRQNFGRFRMCYQAGLGRNPSLEGRVSVRFVIGRDGAVSNVGLAAGLPDATVNDCLRMAFYGLSFSAPDNGIVQVTYPLVFSPE